MTTLTDQLRAALAYAGDNPNMSERANWGRSLESARLAPIHAALIECVSALEWVSTHDREHGESQVGEVTDAALTALKAACAGEK